MTINLIKQLQNTNSRLEKEKLLTDAWYNNERDFFIAAKLVYDPLVTFGIAKVAEIVDDDSFQGTYTFKDFLMLLDQLEKRALTGNAARNAIHSAAEQCSTEVWNLFFRRILLKDLRIGVEDKTINKVLKAIAKSDPSAIDYIIPIFSCQLASSSTDHEAKIAGNMLLDNKLDGTRFLTILNKDNNTIKQYTRNGIENNNFSDICEMLLPLLKDIPISLVLDGEMVSRSFQELMTQINRKDNVNTNDAKLALFDVIPLSDFRNGICHIPQQKRHDMLVELSGLLQLYTKGKVYIIPKLLVNVDTDEGKQMLDEFNQTSLDAGYEGIVIKNSNAPYETKRTTSWLKLKPHRTVDLTIVGFEEGTGKYKDTLGALVCDGFDDKKHIITNVGSGLTDDLRNYIWANRDMIVNTVVEIACDCITKNQNDSHYSLRFPRFKCFRKDKI